MRFLLNISIYNKYIDRLNLMQSTWFMRVELTAAPSLGKGKQNGGLKSEIRRRRPFLLSNQMKTLTILTLIRFES